MVINSRPALSAVAREETLRVVRREASIEAAD